jgi:hypothetical protein
VSWRRAVVDSLKGALYFGLIGPPVGALALTVASLSRMGWEYQENPLAALYGVFGFALFSILFSWFMGVVPAAVTGLLLGPFRWRFHLWRWCLAAGVVGALVSSASLLVDGLPGELGRQSPGLLLVFPGFVAGVLVARLFAVRASYPPPAMPPVPQPTGIGESP